MWGKSFIPRLGAAVFKLRHRDDLERPVFIIGCGRSGTTMFGYALSQHPDVRYLNERRDIWTAVYPEDDIWSKRAWKENGKLVLTSSDTTPVKRAALRERLKMDAIWNRKSCLVEKLPINNFRIPFLLAHFPEARLIIMRRNGIEVARSIAKFNETQPWFGEEDYKWDQLKELCRLHSATKAIPEACQNDEDRGLLEWRLSNEAIDAAIIDLPPGQVLNLSYAELLADPEARFSAALKHIGLNPSRELDTWIANTILRKSPSLKEMSISDHQAWIGGPELARSMNW